MPSSSTIVAAGALALSTLFSPVAAVDYNLKEKYSDSNFFDAFNFFTDADPTNGFVTYKSRDEAQAQNLIANINGMSYMGVDYYTPLSTSGPGRSSVRIETKKSWTKGLFIVDLAHMPGTACGSWPAFWTLGSGQWPTNGEIDIIEGVNKDANDLIALHTGTQCSVSGTGQSGTFLTDNCAVSHSTTGCTTRATKPNSFGTPFNANGGGVYAMEWTSQAIKMWFFPRGAIPSSITAGTPDVSQFGTPDANYEGACDIDSSFKEHRLIFNTAFCGDWAGNVYGTSGCPTYSGLDSMSSCKRYVAENPTMFSQSYWLINSLSIYEAVVPVLSTSSVASSSIPAASTSSLGLTTVDAGQGRSSTTLGFNSTTTTMPLSTGMPMSTGVPLSTGVSDPVSTGPYGNSTSPTVPLSTGIPMSTGIPLSTGMTNPVSTGSSPYGNSTSSPTVPLSTGVYSVTLSTGASNPVSVPLSTGGSSQGMSTSPIQLSTGASTGASTGIPTSMSTGSASTGSASSSSMSTPIYSSSTMVSSDTTTLRYWNTTRASSVMSDTSSPAVITSSPSMSGSSTATMTGPATITSVITSTIVEPCPTGGFTTRTIYITTTVCRVCTGGAATPTGSGRRSTRPTTRPITRGTPKSSIVTTVWGTSTIYRTVVVTITSCAPGQGICYQTKVVPSTSVYVITTTIVRTTPARKPNTTRPATSRRVTGTPARSTSPAMPSQPGNPGNPGNPNKPSSAQQSGPRPSNPGSPGIPGNPGTPASVTRVVTVNVIPSPKTSPCPGGAYCPPSPPYGSGNSTRVRGTGTGRVGTTSIRRSSSTSASKPVTIVTTQPVVQSTPASKTTTATMTRFTGAAAQMEVVGWAAGVGAAVAAFML